MTTIDLLYCEKYIIGNRKCLKFNNYYFRIEYFGYNYHYFKLYKYINNRFERVSYKKFKI